VTIEFLPTEGRLTPTDTSRGAMMATLLSSRPDQSMIRRKLPRLIGIFTCRIATSIRCLADEIWQRRFSPEISIGSGACAVPSNSPKNGMYRFSYRENAALPHLGR
jgi:hypothetical protein